RTMPGSEHLLPQNNKPQWATLPTHCYPASALPKGATEYRASPLSTQTHTGPPTPQHPQSAKGHKDHAPITR
ncbi:MAG TPA: hypothetical protein VEX13_10190, partial [Chloroflexia bacterium]|nr:hypothetical protein [Chloroflexia bacterium]